MPVITFVSTDGSRREVNAPSRTSAMSGAVQNGVKGILAECGGGCACATCHVYVDPGCMDLLPEPSDLESDLLEAVASERKENSRLSCQIKVTAEMDGKLILYVPDTQV